MRNEQRAESIRQAWAERIADSQLREYNDRHGQTLVAALGSFGRAREVRQMLTATALQAMNEYRGHYATTERKN